MTKELIAKLEALEAPDEVVFWEVFLAVYPMPASAYSNWMALGTEFEAKIKCEAWESAAIMLVPDGVDWVMDAEENSASLGIRPFADYYANHPAIALLVCILKARGE